MIVTWRWSISIFSLLPRGFPIAGPAFGGEGRVQSLLTHALRSRHGISVSGRWSLDMSPHVCSWRTSVFHLRNRLLTLPGGPLDPLDRYRNPKKRKQFGWIFLIFYHYFAIYYLSLFHFRRPFNIMNRCWNPSRMISNYHCFAIYDHFKCRRFRHDRIGCYFVHWKSDEFFLWPDTGGVKAAISQPNPKK